MTTEQTEQTQTQEETEKTPGEVKVPLSARFVELLAWSLAGANESKGVAALVQACAVPVETSAGIALDRAEVRDDGSILVRTCDARLRRAMVRATGLAWGPSHRWTRDYTPDAGEREETPWDAMARQLAGAPSMPSPEEVRSTMLALGYVEPEPEPEPARKPVDYTTDRWFILLPPWTWGE